MDANEMDQKKPQRRLKSGLCFVIVILWCATMTAAMKKKKKKTIIATSIKSKNARLSPFFTANEG